jgi:hypothetical protein
VGGPPDHGVEKAAAIGIGPARVVTRGIDEVVGVARGVRQVIDPLVFVQPRAFEVAPGVIAGPQGPALLIEDPDFGDTAGEGFQVGGELGDARTDGGFVVAGFPALGIKAAGPPFLQLPAPDAAPGEVEPAVVVGQATGIDAVGAGDGRRLGLEGTLGAVADRDTDAKETLLVAGGEIEVVAAVLEGGVGRPQLLAGPGHVLEIQGHPVVGHGAADLIEGEDMVVRHVVLVTQIVVGNVGFAIVRRINVDPAVENVGGGISCIEVRNQGRD